MHELAARQQPAGGLELAAHRIGGLVDMHAGEMRHPGVERAVRPHRVRHLDAVLAAEREILLAMAGRDMHEAGAGIGGDEIRHEERHVMVVAAPAQRMRRDRAGELLTLNNVQTCDAW